MLPYCRPLFFLSLTFFFISNLCAQSATDLNKPEKLFFNANIYTANIRQPYAEAVLVRGDKIIAVGNLNEVKSQAGKTVVLIDLHKGCLLPGMIDSHTHAIDGGDGLLKANLFDELVDIPHLADYVRKVMQDKKNLPGNVVVIEGINIAIWSMLEEVISTFNHGDFVNQPVWLRGSDGHTSWANSASLKQAGIDQGYIHALTAANKKFYGVDSNEIPNGFMSESGQQKMESLLPANSVDYDASAKKALEYNNAYGITAWLDPSVGYTATKKMERLQAYDRLARQHQLTAHVATTLVADADADPAPQIAWVKSLQGIYNQPDLRVLGFKIFADGVVEHPTHTAALSKPYTGGVSAGVLMYEPQKFNTFVVAADRQKMLVHVHAIGDFAVTRTLDGFEAARKANGNSGLPHTITHLQFVLPADQLRFAKLQVLASMQLLWAFGDVTTIDIVKPYIDSTIYRYQYPSRSMMQQGAIICGASDWPVSSGNPFEAMYKAETRKGPMGVLDSLECMPRVAMLQAYTINAAKAMMQEHLIGSIEPGKSADLILLDRDVLTVDADSLRTTQVIWTLFRGRLVYHRP